MGKRKGAFPLRWIRNRSGPVFFTDPCAPDILWRTGFTLMRSSRGRSEYVLILVSALLALSAMGATPQNHAHQTAARQASSTKTTAASPASSVEVINGSSVETQVFNASQPAAPVQRHLKSVPAANTVEVINGSAKRTVVLDTQQSTGPRSLRAGDKRSGKRPGERGARAVPSVTRVETINGTFREIKLLNADKAEASGAGIGRRSAQPVVVGIISSDTRRVGGNRQQVVVGIASSGSKSETAPPVVIGIGSADSENEGSNPQPVAIGMGSSKSKSEKAQAVVIGIAPRLKRPPYRP